jgi:hypothetical protein
MQQQGLACLAGDFLGGDQILRYLADGAVAGLQLRLGIQFVAVVENADDETLGFQLGRRLRGKNGLHCFLSFKHLSARQCRGPRRGSARWGDCKRSLSITSITICELRSPIEPAPAQTMGW